MTIIGLQARYFHDPVRDEPAIRILAKTSKHEGVYVVLPCPELTLDPKAAMSRFACDLENAFNTIEWMIDHPDEAKAEQAAWKEFVRNGCPDDEGESHV